MPTSEEHSLTPDGFAATLSARALHCRELGHTWRAWTVEHDRKARLYIRQLRCSSCRTIRRQELTEDGDVFKNGYQYAAGYLATNVEGHVDRAVFRLESLTRFLDESPRRLRAV